MSESLSYQSLVSNQSSQSLKSKSPILKSSSWPKQLLLQPFDLDVDDAYHYLLTELSPVILEDIPDPDQGNLNHPAAVMSSDQFGLYSLNEVISLTNNDIPAGPLYSPDKALRLALSVSNSGSSNWQVCKIPVKSHLNLPALNTLLADYPDPWVLRGCQFGWPLSHDCSLPLSGVTWKNHASCQCNFSQVLEFFATEVSFGAMFPLGINPKLLPPPVSTIPLLCVPKPAPKTKVRVCGDMSFPPGFSVNDGIASDSYEGEPYHCHLPTIWDYIAHIRHIGLADAVIAKADFSRGYIQIPIDPGDWLLQMFHLPNHGYYLDTRAIFGGRPCSLMMQRTHQALAWAGVNTAVSINHDVMASSTNQQHSYYRANTPYIDDSLLVAHISCADSSAWENILAVFKAANIQLSLTEGHVCPPSRKMRALGFDLDLNEGTISLPIHKLHEMLEFASYIMNANQITKQDIKKLIGRISRCIMVIREGRRFISRLLLLLQGPILPGNTVVNLPDGAKEDLQWWLIYGPKLNAKTLITLPTLPLTSVFLVDGRVSNGNHPPTVGGLCYHTSEFCSMVVPQIYHDEPIHIIEAIALLAASRLWVSKMPEGHLIPVGSDNQAVVLSYQHGRAKEPKLAAMARLLWGIFAMSSCSFNLRYVPSAKNSSDGVSRLNKDHISFLLSQKWSQLYLPEEFFPLDESNPFLYQEVTPKVL